jgi:hypothetical protein
MEIYKPRITHTFFVRAIYSFLSLTISASLLDGESSRSDFHFCHRGSRYNDLLLSLLLTPILLNVAGAALFASPHGIVKQTGPLV